MVDRYKVSVIVPVYNAEKRLRLCVNSILAQTEQSMEVILIDDGSTDGSAGICDAYAHGDPRVKVIHQDNKGVSAARNCGLEAAVGRYVTFVDSDDTIDERFLQDALTETEQCGADVFMSGLSMETWREDMFLEKTIYTAKERKQYSTQSLFQDLEKNFPLITISGPCCKLYRRSLIEENHIRFNTNLSCGEDTYFNLDILMARPSIIMSNQYCYHYFRGNPSSLFSRFRPDIYEVITAVYDYMRQVMLRMQCGQQAMHDFEKMYVTQAVGCIRHYFAHKTQNSKKERYEIIKKVFQNPYVRRRYKFDKITSTSLLFQLGRCRLYGLIYIACVFLHSKGYRQIRGIR